MAITLLPLSWTSRVPSAVCHDVIQDAHETWLITDSFDQLQYRLLLVTVMYLISLLFALPILHPTDYTLAR